MAKFITHGGQKINVSEKPKIVYQSKDGRTTVYGRPAPETKKLTTQNLLRGNDGRIIKTYDSGRTIVHSKVNPNTPNVKVSSVITDTEKRIAELNSIKKNTKNPDVKYRNGWSYHDREDVVHGYLKQLIPNTVYTEESAIQNRMSKKRSMELINMLNKANGATNIFEVLRTNSNGGFVNRLGMS